MAIIPSQKNPLAILRQFRAQLSSQAGLTNFDRDSKTRAISDVLTEELLEVREEMTSAIYANQLSNARSKNLDVLGETLGETRRYSTFASVSLEELSLAFYVESGTFGTINGAADITITAGTVVTSNPNNNELGATIQYTVLSDTILPAATAIGYVSARADTLGTGHNVGQGVLRTHNFTSYVDSASSSLKVVNFYPVLNGRDEEVDELYRFRIAQHYNRLAQVNDSRIQLSALEIPGVVNLRVISGHYGIGTAGVVVLGAESQSNARMVQGVQERIGQHRAPGLTVLATAATQVSFDLELEIHPVRTMTAAEKARLEGQIRRAAMNYFRSASSGSVVALPDLARQIQRDSGGAINLGSVGAEAKLFKKAYIRKGFPNGSTSEKEKLIVSQLALAQDEFADVGTLSYTYVGG